MNKKKNIQPRKEIISKLDVNEDDSNSKKLDNDFISRKKELILLDYQTLFDIYGREFTVIYSFRGWAVTLLTAYFGLLLTARPINNPLINLPGVFIIIAFYILEVAERSVMRRLLKEVRYVESIFMLQSSVDFRRAITKYEFRDLRDAKIPLKKKNRRPSAFSFPSASSCLAYFSFSGLLYLDIYFAHFKRNSTHNFQMIIKKYFIYNVINNYK